MKLYECEGCGEQYYNKRKECPYCNSKIFTETESTEREVLYAILKAISLSSGEYEEFNEDSLEERVEEELEGFKFKWVEFSLALDQAVEKGFFSKVIIYVSSA